MQKPKFISLLLLIIVSMMLVSCANRVKKEVPVKIDSIDDLKNLSVQRRVLNDHSKMSPIRRTAIEETALSVAARSALAVRSKHINKMLDQNARYLDQVFDFNALLLEDNIIPPVLLEGRHTLKLDDPGTMRLAGRTYRIHKQAHFATTPPQWRNYIWMDYEEPEQPDISLLPKTSHERSIWNAAVEEGWKNGDKQAAIIFNDNLARLRQEYLGMVRYRKLLTEKLVTAPYVSRTELGVTGGGDELNIDDRVLRIAALPQLNAEAKIWEPALAKEKNKIQAIEKQLSKFGSHPENIMETKGWHPLIRP